MRGRAVGKSLKRVFAVYLSRGELSSLQDLAWVPRDKLGETILSIGGQEYFALSKHFESGNGANRRFLV